MNAPKFRELAIMNARRRQKKYSHATHPVLYTLNYELIKLGKNSMTATVSIITNVDQNPNSPMHFSFNATLYALKGWENALYRILTTLVYNGMVNKG